MTVVLVGTFPSGSTNKTHPRALRIQGRERHQDARKELYIYVLLLTALDLPTGWSLCLTHHNPIYAYSK